MKSGILLQPPTTRAGCSWHLTSTILGLNERQPSSLFYWKDFGTSDTQRAWALLGSKGDQRCWGFLLIHFIQFSQLLDVSSSVQFSRSSCPTLSNPMDCSLPGSSIHGIFQARVLEWGAIAFSVIISISNNNVIIIMEQNEACLE